MRHTSCFNLPIRFFSFPYVTPVGDKCLIGGRSTPSTLICDSFHAFHIFQVSGEMLMLDPLSGVVGIPRKCAGKAKQTEGMMEQAMLEAASLIIDASGYRRPTASSSTPFMTTTTTLGTP
jgi:hypothetical protein